MCLNGGRLMGISLVKGLILTVSTLLMIFKQQLMEFPRSNNKISHLLRENIFNRVSLGALLVLALD